MLSLTLMNIWWLYWCPNIAVDLKKIKSILPEHSRKHSGGYSAMSLILSLNFTVVLGYPKPVPKYPGDRIRQHFALLQDQMMAPSSQPCPEGAGGNRHSGGSPLCYG